MGECLGDLVCEGGVCVVDGGTTSSGDGDGDSGDGDGDSGDGDGDGDSGDGDGDSGDGDGDGDSGDGDSGDGDGDSCEPNELLCDGFCVDPTSDPENCGMCGHICEIKNDIGGCSESVCEPTLSECIHTEDPPVSCNDVCAGEGKLCIAQGCGGGATFYPYGSLNICEMFIGAGQSSPCTDPTVLAAGYYRCCCGEP
ncbi:Endo-1,4-beta-xylanase A precursor [Enhygromyxa salina]|uniref:Endo-1,4-beta-xylanase A n=1 Tax=Enhygromyxa salina TaxID=215803 RepID=A0A0C1Z2E2_9BACT|nr:hypothetical protein [Enhygromyxa salina]KIG11574.1 Endo-1,4-beta-xylanase A precursor [Enhygromyxa salina]